MKTYVDFFLILIFTHYFHMVLHLVNVGRVETTERERERELEGKKYKRVIFLEKEIRNIHLGNLKRSFNPLIIINTFLLQFCHRFSIGYGIIILLKRERELHTKYVDMSSFYI